MYVIYDADINAKTVDAINSVIEIKSTASAQGTSIQSQEEYDDGSSNDLADSGQLSPGAAVAELAEGSPSSSTFSDVQSFMVGIVIMQRIKTYGLGLGYDYFQKIILVKSFYLV
jgi:hypothetical protein